ncbi:MAG: efflux transporter outer membrane subunit [Planctomycetota bacterium]
MVISEILRLPLPRRYRSWLLGLALPLSIGCTTFKEYVHNGFKVGPQYAKPPAPVAEQWIDNADKRISPNTDDHRKWWTSFRDPNLDSLICMAAGQNLSLREAGFRVLASRAKLGIAVGEFFPQSQFANAGFLQYGLSTAVANRQFIAQAYYPLWNYGAGLAWELDFWGKYRRAIEAASSALDASVESYDNMLVILLGDVAESYVRMRFFENQAEIAASVAQFQKESLTIAQARFRGGLTSEVDVDQAQADLSKTQAEIPNFQAFARIENNRLCNLLGIAPEDLEKRLGKGPIPSAGKDVVTGIPAELLSRRPDVRQAERQAAEACANIGVATSELYPHISIAGNFGWSALSYGNLYSPEAFGGTIGPSFRWNIFNYGRLVNHVRLQDANFQAAIANYQQVVVKAGAEVEDGLVRFLKGQERAKELETAVEAAKKAATIAQAQYKAGTVDFNRVSLLQEKLLDRQLSLANAQREVAAGLVMTYKALGGGWQIRLDGCEPTPIVENGSIAQPTDLPKPRRDDPESEAAPAPPKPAKP